MSPEGLEQGQSAEETRDILNAIRRLKIARLRLVRELSWFLDELPQEDRADLLKTVFEVFDGSSMAESANSMSRLFMTIHTERPEFASELFPDIEAFFNETDFGKMREAVNILLDYWATLACKSFDMVADNPVVIANVIGMLPPVVNSLVKVLSYSLGKLEMPPEVLASSLFNLLLELDAGEIGRAMNSMLALTGRFMEANPELLRRVAADTMGTVNRERLAAVLREAYREVGLAAKEDPGIRKSLAPEEVGRRFNDLIVRFNDSPAARPGAVKDYVSRTLSAIDSNELERALRTLIGGATDAVLESAGRVRAIVRPFMNVIWRSVRMLPRLLKNLHRRSEKSV